MRQNYRCCISCRKAAHKAEFLRVVRQHATNVIKIGEGMGRSAYICPSIQCVGFARKKRRLGKALKVAVPQNVYDELANHLP